MLEGQLGDPPRRLPSFARGDIAVAELAPDPALMGREAGVPASGSIAVPCVAAPTAPTRGGVIEIVLPIGVTVRVDAQVDGPAPRQVLAASAGR